MPMVVEFARKIIGLKDVDNNPNITAKQFVERLDTKLYLLYRSRYGFGGKLPYNHVLKQDDLDAGKAEEVYIHPHRVWIGGDYDNGANEVYFSLALRYRENGNMRTVCQLQSEEMRQRNYSYLLIIDTDKAHPPQASYIGFHNTTHNYQQTTHKKAHELTRNEQSECMKMMKQIEERNVAFFDIPEKVDYDYSGRDLLALGDYITSSQKEVTRHPSLSVRDNAFIHPKRFRPRVKK